MSDSSQHSSTSSPSAANNAVESAKTDLQSPEAKMIAQLQQQVAMLKQQVELSERMSTVGTLASSITHEFNNILMTVINYAKMGTRHKDDATRDKAFDKILAAGQRAAKITTGMLAYARGKSGHRDRVNLAQLVTDVVVLVEKDLQVHRISVDLQLQPDVEVTLDGIQVQQVLMNLIINARQAMNDGGSLLISVSELDDQWAELRVKDSGEGIPSDKLARIFEPFFTTKTTDSHGQGGTGLGLSHCRDVMVAHQGRVRVQSELNVGTEFLLHFPRKVSGFVQSGDQNSASSLKSSA